ELLRRALKWQRLCRGNTSANRQLMAASCDLFPSRAEIFRAPKSRCGLFVAGGAFLRSRRRRIQRGPGLDHFIVAGAAASMESLLVCQHGGLGAAFVLQRRNLWQQLRLLIRAGMTVYADIYD